MVLNKNNLLDQVGKYVFIFSKSEWECSGVSPHLVHSVTRNGFYDSRGNYRSWHFDLDTYVVCISSDYKNNYASKYNFTEDEIVSKIDL